MTTENAIELKDVTRTFDGTAAVDDLSLSVRRGELYGFLGPNGAGKSTTIGLLMNYFEPTGGRVRVLGSDVQNAELEVKARTGVLPEGFTPYPRLTGWDHLRFVCSVRGDDAAPETFLDRVGILEAADQKASSYSKGMTRRLGLAMALVDSPDVLILDEPFAGLDPGGAKRLRDLIREENDSGTTVFFSSHQLAHVAAVCDRVGIIDEGRLVVQASLTDPERSNDGGRLSVELAPPPSDVPSVVASIEGLEDARIDGARLVLEYTDERSCADSLSALFASTFDVVDVELHRSVLEELYTTAVGV